MRLVRTGALTGALVVGTLLAGCGRAGEEENVGRATDTLITPRQTQDTTIISSDTTVRVDTTIKKGQGAVPVDTAKQRQSQ